MKRMKSLFIAMVLTMMVGVFAVAPIAAYGATDDAAGSVGNGEMIAAHATIDGAADSMSNDELFAAYVDQQFDLAYDELSGTESLDTMSVSDARDQLDALGQSVYDVLLPEVMAVAEGTEQSTVFTILPSMLPSGASSSDVFAAIKKATKALVEDCPYEFYWYDSVSGVKMNYNGRAYTVSYCVSADYSATGATGTFDVRSDLSIVKTAASNAAAIVTKHEGEDDYAKLDSYRSEICNLAAYNYDAVNDKSRPYGDPWQLIWVFDGDTATKVVCEGYAKAFKYLCDLSTFNNATVDCYTVSGTMQTDSEPFDHMWNIVTVDGKSYLADITNCDTGTVGSALQASGTAPGTYLFMKGYSAVISNGYRIDIPAKKVTSGSVIRRTDATSVSYTYDSDASAILGESVLKLSDKDCPTDIDGLGSIDEPANVKPKQAAITKLAVGEKKLTVTVKDQASTGITGYQIKYRQKGASKWKTKTLKADKTKLTIKNLKTGKKYQVKVRGYVTSSDKTTYGEFSETKTSKAVK